MKILKKVNDPLKKSEVIVILGAGFYNAQLLDFWSLTRLLKGVEIYREKWAPVIICSGGIRTSGSDKTIARLMKETLKWYGVNNKDILVQDDTINTYNDINAVIKKYGKQFNFNRAIFVTSSFHTHRVKKILLKKGYTPIVVCADPNKENRGSWLRKSYNIKNILLLREILTNIYFKIKGWI